MKKFILGFLTAYMIFNPKTTISIFSFILNTSNTIISSVSFDKIEPKK